MEWICKKNKSGQEMMAESREAVGRESRAYPPLVLGSQKAQLWVERVEPTFP